MSDRTCAFDGCARPHYAKGMCNAHYQRSRKGTSPDRPLAHRRVECTITGCARPEWAMGLCPAHYKRSRLGKPMVADLRNSPGAGHIDADGYVMVHEGGRRIPEHRLVMQRALGRRLSPQESVHHINGDRSDNRVENLELWSRSQPAGQRVVDKVAWAIELLRAYAPERLAGDGTD